MSLAIIYGSSMGNAEEAADLIKKELNLDVDILNIADIDAETINAYDKLICGTSTWNDGELQDDWDCFNFTNLNLKNKTVALFGVGDSQGYSDSFCNAMGELYDIFKEKGANLVGGVSLQGYEFDESKAVRDGKFVGLALDFDNESDKNEARIKNWIKEIKKYFE